MRDKINENDIAFHLRLYENEIREPCIHELDLYITAKDTKYKLREKIPISYKEVINLKNNKCDMHHLYRKFGYDKLVSLPGTPKGPYFWVDISVKEKVNESYKEIKREEIKTKLAESGDLILPDYKCSKINIDDLRFTHVYTPQFFDPKSDMYEVFENLRIGPNKEKLDEMINEALETNKSVDIYEGSHLVKEIDPRTEPEDWYEYTNDDISKVWFHGKITRSLKIDEDTPSLEIKIEGEIQESGF